MSNKSNNQGRAYEFAYLITLFEEISKIRPAKIEENSSYFSAERAWNTLTDSEKTIYKVSALAVRTALRRALTALAAGWAGSRPWPALIWARSRQGLPML